MELIALSSHCKLLILREERAKACELVCSQNVRPVVVSEEDTPCYRDISEQIHVKTAEQTTDAVSMVNELDVLHHGPLLNVELRQTALDLHAFLDNFQRRLDEGDEASRAREKRSILGSGGIEAQLPGLRGLLLKRLIRDPLYDGKGRLEQSGEEATIERGESIIPEDLTRRIKEARILRGARDSPRELLARRYCH